MNIGRPVMKNDKGLISIIVPIYNVEKYLKKCIDSLLEQTYKNIEIILIDDQSPDNCGKICDEYTKLDNRIRVIHQENSGVGKARERAMDIAEGEYLTFVDGDDWLAPDFCEKMLTKLLFNDVDWIACNAKELDENGKEINAFNNIETEEFIKDNKILFDDYFKGKNYTRVVWGKLFKTSIIKKYKFKELKMCEDTCFMIELFKSNLKVGLIKDYCYNYIRRGNSVTSNLKFRVEDFDWLKGLEYIENDVKKICLDHCKDIEIQRYEVLVSIYILLLEKGTKYEKKKYKKKIRTEIINISVQVEGWLYKHLIMIKYMNCLYELLIYVKYKLNHLTCGSRHSK